MLENETSSVIDYNEIKTDPRKLLLLLNKFVEVELIKKITRKGFIQSIDSLTYSIVLIEPKDETFQTTIIPGHAILNISELDSDNIKKPPIKQKIEITAPPINVEERKKKIMMWFKKNLLPVSESDDNIVFGNVFILPPYSVDDICTDNTVVAKQVMHVIQKMPDDF